MKQIILNETQFTTLIEQNLLIESIFEVNSLEEFKQELKNKLKYLIMAGISTTTIITMINSFCDNHNVKKNTKQEVMAMVDNYMEKQGLIKGDWMLADTKTIATVYNAVPEQCNGDYTHTASMFKLNINDVLSHRIIAMERTFMKKLNLKYGDVVYIQGTDKYDGVWQIQDTMNKRFAGQHKIDILVPNNIKYGAWDNVKLYVLKDKSLTQQYRSNMSKPLNKQIMANI